MTVGRSLPVSMRALEWSIPFGTSHLRWRPATFDDIPAVVEILRKEWELHQRDVDPDLLEADYLRWTDDWTERLRDRGAERPYQLGVLTMEERVCGFVDWTLEDDSVLAYNAAVDHSVFRGLVGGGAVLNVLVQLAEVGSIDHVSLCTNVSMTGNVRLYEWIGFEKQGTYEEADIERVSMKADVAELAWVKNMKLDDFRPRGIRRKKDRRAPD